MAAGCLWSRPFPKIRQSLARQQQRLALVLAPARTGTAGATPTLLHEGATEIGAVATTVEATT
jgi:hypothetical protein